MKKGGERLGASESAVEAGKDHDSRGPPGGRGQTQPGQVRRVHWRKSVLRHQRGPRIPVSKGWGVQALARPVHQQSQPGTNPRRRSYEDRAVNMKPRPTQFGTREITASSRQHAPRPALNASVQEFDPLSTTEQPGKSTYELVPPINQTFELSLTEPDQGTTGGEERGTITSGALGDGKRPTIERPLTCGEAAAFVRVHPKTVKRMARSGELPGHFRFGRWFFYVSELDCWMRTELHSSRHSYR